MSTQIKSNPEKALVAKYWTAVVLTDLGFKIEIRSTASRLIVPTQIVYTEMEQAYKALGSTQLSQRTFYWEDGPKPHYGYERKLRPYRNAWNLPHQAKTSRPTA